MRTNFYEEVLRTSVLKKPVADCYMLHVTGFKPETRNM